MTVTRPDINTVMSGHGRDVHPVRQAQPHEQRFFQALFGAEGPAIQPDVGASRDTIDVFRRGVDCPPPLTAKCRMGAAPEPKPLPFLPVCWWLRGVSCGGPHVA